MEIWKEIPNTNGQYSVSNLGRVRSNWARLVTKDIDIIQVREKILSQNRAGYQKCAGGYTHRVVATLFIPNPHNYDQVHHKDGNKKNNCVENLEWIDGAEHLSKHTKGKRFTEEHKKKLSGPNPKKARKGCLNGR